MPKADATPKTEAGAPATGNAAEAAQPPRMGELIHVRVADGLLLTNNETGAPFVPGEATAQTVTPTALRRLQDGDLVRV